MTLVRLLLRPPPQWLTRLIAGALILCALVGSLLPQMGPPSEFGIDKMVHVLGYATLAFALGEVRGVRWPLALTLAMAMGGLAELLQTAVPGRDGSWPDFFASTLGAVLGVVVQAGLVQARIRARSVSPTRGNAPVGGASDPVPLDSGKHP
jgi:VanZ family protein